MELMSGLVGFQGLDQVVPRTWSRIQMLYSRSLVRRDDPRKVVPWPRNFKEYADRRHRQDWAAAVRSWALRLPEKAQVVLNVEESLRLPIDRSRPGSFVHELTSKQQLALAHYYVELMNDTIATIREVSDASVAIFQQRIDSYESFVKGMSPIYSNLDWIGVSWYIHKPITTLGVVRPWWKRHLQGAVEITGDVAERPVYPFLNPRYRGSGDWRDGRSISRADARGLVKLAKPYQRAVLWSVAWDWEQYWQSMHGIARLGMEAHRI